MSAFVEELEEVEEAEEVENCLLLLMRPMKRAMNWSADRAKEENGVAEKTAALMVAEATVCILSRGMEQSQCQMNSARLLSHLFLLFRCSMTHSSISSAFVLSSSPSLLSVGGAALHPVSLADGTVVPVEKIHCLLMTPMGSSF